jgi:polar amino acid transport system substrate-binding protein
MSINPSRQLLTLALFTFWTAVASADPLVVNTGFTPPVSTLFNAILGELGRRIDREIRFQEMTAERSLMLVNSGVDDGECCRIPGVVLNEYPNLILVPESVFRVEFVAFTKNPQLQIRHWHDLRPYNVATVTGWKILVKNIGRIHPAGFTVLDDAESMFRMLELDRIDIATLSRLSGLDVIRRLGLKGIRVLEPPLAKRDLYLLLHRRHAPLLPRIQRALRDMKADGTMQRLISQVISPEPSPARPATPERPD